MTEAPSTPLILVLEDEVVVAMEIEIRLVSLGYRVAGPVSTVDAALLLAQRERPDLLLADVRLEGTQDGITAAAALRAQLGVPVVYLTAHTDAATLARAIPTEPFGYLTKPLRESELHATITTALYRHRLERALAERERQLESSEARFRAVFEGASDGLLVVDPRGRVKLANASAELLFGHTRGELTGIEIEDLVPVASGGAHVARRAEFAADPRARIMATGCSVNGRTKDGREVVLEIGLSQAQIEDELCVVVAARDITDKGRAERELAAARARVAQSQRLEAIGRLAGGVAHDFNNLLTVILGMSRMLMPMLVGQAQGLSLVADIQEAGTRAADLVSRLLAFARRRPVAARCVSIDAEIRNFAQLLSRIVGPRIEIVTELGADPCQVWIDPTHVEQLLLNLSVNARDAMPRGGRLHLRTRSVVRARGESLRGWLVLEVEDDGCGMSEEVSGRIFEPFFTTKPFGEGSGLGMSIVYGLVTQAGGDVVVRSSPGAGTTFTIWLPLHDGDRLPHPPRDDLSMHNGEGERLHQSAMLSEANDERSRG